MDRADLYAAIGAVDDEILERSEQNCARAPRPLWVKFAAAAAILALIAVGVGGWLLGRHRRINAPVSATDWNISLTPDPSPVPETTGLHGGSNETQNDQVPGGFGASAHFTFTLQETPEGLPEALWDVAWPVFHNPYPTGQGGPEYEITQQITDRETAALTEYLTLLSGGSELAFYQPDYAEELVICRQGDWEYYGHVDDAIAASGPVSLSWPATAEELLNDPHVTAALVYVGISQPRVTVRAVPGTEAEEVWYEFQFTQPREDAQSQRIYDHFCHVVVRLFPAEGGARMQLQLTRTAPETLETVRSESTPSRVALASYLAEAFPELDPDQLPVDVVYRAEGDLYVPCFLIYLPYEKSRDPAGRLIYQFVYVDWAELKAAE